MLMKHLIDSVLVTDTKRLVTQERKITAEILRHLEEIDRRKLYVEYGHPSMVQFCIKELKYSESAAYRRLSSARLIREVPQDLPLIASGELSTTNAALAKDFFKAEGIKDLSKKKDVVSSLLGKSTREAEYLLRGQSSVQSTFRRKSILRRATGTDWELAVTISGPLKEKMERVRHIKSHTLRNWEDVLDFAMDVTLRELTKIRTPRATGTKSRSPTPAMKNLLLRQAEYRCQHPGCSSKSFLQMDHIEPVVRGGRTEMKNLQVLCAAHNLRKK